MHRLERPGEEGKAGCPRAELRGGAEGDTLKRSVGLLAGRQRRMKLQELAHWEQARKHK